LALWQQQRAQCIIIPPIAKFACPFLSVDSHQCRAWTAEIDQHAGQSPPVPSLAQSLESLLNRTQDTRNARGKYGRKEAKRRGATCSQLAAAARRADRAGRHVHADARGLGARGRCSRRGGCAGRWEEGAAPRSSAAGVGQEAAGGRRLDPDNSKQRAASALQASAESPSARAHELRGVFAAVCRPQHDYPRPDFRGLQTLRAAAALDPARRGSSRGVR
jgi:hypothetical protein